MRKLQLTGLLIIILFTLSVQTSFAQSVGINLQLGTKSINSNNLPIDLTISSGQSVGPVKVQWIVPYGATPTNGERTTFNANLEQNDIIQDHFVLTFLTPGTYPITANITGVYNGVTFSRSQSVNVTIDNNMNVVNTATEYTIKKVIYTILLFISAIIIIVKIKEPYLYLKKRFLNWLNKEDKMV